MPESPLLQEIRSLYRLEGLDGAKYRASNVIRAFCAMNYRHAYHAGNHADVLKHLVLLALLDALQKKDKPLLYLDTHAGRGLYDLKSDETTRAAEAQTGIERLREQAAQSSQAAPPAIERYLAATRSTTGRYYPGSPTLIADRQRPQDRLIACELHAEDLRALTKRLTGPRQTALHMDGWQAIRAKLPPIERRALILIDPPYERPDEYRKIETALQDGLKRMETGVFALWYPIKDRAPLERLHRRLVALTARPILRVEMNIWPESPGNRLNGSGMLVINPPWQLDQELAVTLNWLQPRLRQDDNANWRIDWLNPAA